MTNPTTMLATLKDALDRNDHDGVNAACRALIKARAQIGGQWRAVALLLLENGEMTDARRAADLLLSATNNSPLGRYVQAEIYARSGRAAQALAILKTVPENIPDPLSHAYTLGTTATNVGAFDEARTYLRRAVALAPQSGQSWLALAMLGRIEAEDGQRLAAMRDKMRTAPPVERGPYFYALGKYLEERGEHAEAFASFSVGAGAEAAVRPGEAGGPLPSQGWTAQALAGLPRPGRLAARPIFVTGLPRAGTTLVEQIIAAHSKVDGGEELGLFRHLIADAGGMDIETTGRVLRSGQADTLIKLYEHRLGQRFPGTGRVIDKSLLASRYMGMLTALFPDAPVLWLRRDPLDHAWSIFRTYFRKDMGWTFDLRQIAEQMRIEDQLFEHWTQLRPQQILPVDYIELVTAPETVIPRIVAHCGLELEPQQLRPHESRRTVVTASVTQVRRPINRDAVGSAEPYREQLAPFIEAYRAAGGTIA